MTANTATTTADTTTAARPATAPPAPVETRLLPVPAIVRDIGLLLARVLLGAVLIVHGGQKLFVNGVDGTGAFFESVGVPAAQAAAAFAGAVELVGGILLVLGLLTQRWPSSSSSSWSVPTPTSTRPPASTPPTVAGSSSP